MSETQERAGGVAAVVVTFQPDLERLSMLLDATVSQVEHIYVVDNGDGAILQALLLRLQRTSLIALGENRGIAAAQNAGARAALDAGARFVLLLDQDSVPAADLVSKLLAAMGSASLHGLRVAAVGPNILGPDGPEGFLRVGMSGFSIARTKALQSWVECDQLIASGCLISQEALHAVGMMDESFFIDKVDTEWCLRARGLSYSLVGAPDAHLSHRLGRRRVRVWFLRWRNVPIHDAGRYYYMFRNTVHLHRMPHATKRWRIADWSYTLKLLVGIGLTGLAGRAGLYAMLSGLYDGFRGIAGPARSY